MGAGRRSRAPLVVGSAVALVSMVLLAWAVGHVTEAPGLPEIDWSQIPKGLFLSGLGLMSAALFVATWFLIRWIIATVRRPHGRAETQLSTERETWKPRSLILGLAAVLVGTLAVAIWYGLTHRPEGLPVFDLWNPLSGGGITPPIEEYASSAPLVEAVANTFSVAVVAAMGTGAVAVVVVILSLLLRRSMPVQANKVKPVSQLPKSPRPPVSRLEPKVFRPAPVTWDASDPGVGINACYAAFLGLAPFLGLRLDQRTGVSCLTPEEFLDLVILQDPALEAAAVELTAIYEGARFGPGQPSAADCRRMTDLYVEMAEHASVRRSGRGGPARPA